MSAAAHAFRYLHPSTLTPYVDRAVAHRQRRRDPEDAAQGTQLHEIALPLR